MELVSLEEHISKVKDGLKKHDRREVFISGIQFMAYCTSLMQQRSLAKQSQNEFLDHSRLISDLASNTQALTDLCVNNQKEAILELLSSIESIIKSSFSKSDSEVSSKRDKRITFNDTKTDEEKAQRKRSEMDEAEKKRKNRTAFFGTPDSKQNDDSLKKARARRSSIYLPGRLTENKRGSQGICFDDTFIDSKRPSSFLMMQKSVDDCSDFSTEKLSLRASKEIRSSKYKDLGKDVLEWTKEYPELNEKVKSRNSKMILTNLVVGAINEKPVEVPIKENEEEEKVEFWYLTFNYDKSKLLFDANDRVSAASFEMAVKYVARHDKLDLNFTTDVWYTCSLYASTQRFWELLMKLYYAKPPSILNKEEVEIWKVKKLFSSRIKILNNLKVNFTFLDEKLQNELATFCKHEMAKEKNQVILNLLKTLRIMCDNYTKPYDDRPSSPLALKFGKSESLTFKPASILPKKYKFVDISPLELARQITLIDYSLFSAISYKEFLHKAWSDKANKEKAANLKTFIAQTNYITEWITSLILHEIDLKKRVQIIRQAISLAEELRNLKNFTSLMAVLSAFNSAPVHRLKKTFDALPTKSKLSLEEMKNSMHSTENFILYRNQIKVTVPPCIPFLGLFLSDLTFIDDGNPDYVKHMGLELINFDKHRKTASVIKSILKFQPHPYNLRPVKLIAKYLEEEKKKLEESKDDLYSFSLLIEPRSD